MIDNQTPRVGLAPFVAAALGASRCRDCCIERRIVSIIVAINDRVVESGVVR